jgi:lipopolysaccharide export system protein LptC
MRTPDRNRWLLVLLLAAFAAGSWWLTQRLGAPADIAARGPLHEPDYSLDGAVITAMDAQGRVRYSLRATRLVHYADDGSTELVAPYLIQNIEGVWHHTRADKGRLPEDRRVIDLTGNVRSARDRDPQHAGGEIRTEHLRLVLDKS